MTSEELRIVENMEKYGGSFVESLAQCFYHADPINFQKLKHTFALYWEEYEKLGKTYNGRGSNIPEGYGDDGFIK
jgi:tryptophan synthase beta subunit